MDSADRLAGTFPTTTLIGENSMTRDNGEAAQTLQQWYPNIHWTTITRAIAQHDSDADPYLGALVQRIWGTHLSQGIDEVEDLEGDEERRLGLELAWTRLAASFKDGMNASEDEAKLGKLFWQHRGDAIAAASAADVAGIERAHCS